MQAAYDAEWSYKIALAGFLIRSNISINGKGVLSTMSGPISEISTIRHPNGLVYPTQKPVALLDRIIKTSSDPDDIVLDAFCGCGTALVPAQNLDRRWIGIDISPTACRIMAEYRSQQIRTGIPYDAVFGHDTGLPCHGPPSPGGTDERAARRRCT
jgi:DNA modification methylase